MDENNNIDSNVTRCQEIAGARFKNTRDVAASFIASNTEDGYYVYPLEPFTIRPYEEKMFNTGVKISVQQGHKILFASRITGLYPMNYIQDGGEISMTLLNVNYHDVVVGQNDQLAFVWFDKGCHAIDS